MWDFTVFDKTDLFFKATSLYNMPFRSVREPFGRQRLYLFCGELFVPHTPCQVSEAIFMSGPNLPWSKRVYVVVGKFTYLQNSYRSVADRL